MSKIEWTSETWNPVAGCRKVSPGCKNCYAETMSGRLELMGQAAYAGLTRPAAEGKRRLFTGDFRERPGRLDVPLLRKKPTAYFVNSMSDLFGEGVSNEFTAAVFGVMAACPQHTFQVLTKRAKRLPEWFQWTASDCVGFDDGTWSDPLHPHVLLERCLGLERKDLEDVLVRSVGRMFRAGHVGQAPWPLPNVWLGVSVEDRKHGLPRIDELRKVPAAVRFLSIEPLLEDLGKLDLTGIHWVIVGGESGHGARECNADWIRGIAGQCRVAGVPLFVKQGGFRFSDERNGIAGAGLDVSIEAKKLISLRMKDRKGGDINELPRDLRVREMPKGYTNAS